MLIPVGPPCTYTLSRNSRLVNRKSCRSLSLSLSLCVSLPLCSLSRRPTGFSLRFGSARASVSPGIRVSSDVVRGRNMGMGLGEGGGPDTKRTQIAQGGSSEFGGGRLTWVIPLGHPIQCIGCQELCCALRAVWQNTVSPCYTLRPSCNVHAPRM